MTPTATPKQESKLKYLQLEEQLRRQIESGELRPGDRLPSHGELHARYGMTRPTIDRAHALLEQKGLITRIERRGIFVTDRPSSPASEPPGVMVDSGTLVAIGTPDGSIFDRAMSLLLPRVNAAGLSLVCRLMDPARGFLTLPFPQGEKPLGYILFRKDFLPLAKQLQDAGHRVALVGTPYADVTPGVPVAQGDQEQGGYLATQHLLELGHRRIVFRGWGDWSQTRRWRGHQRALTEARKRGVAVEDSAVFEGEYDHWRSAPEAAEAYFRHPKAPTGIVAWNDQDAISLLTLLSYIGIRVPQDVSLVGYDNLPEGQQVHPPLTTVDGAIEQQLQAAFKLLMQPVPPPNSHTIIVLPNLIRRDSSAPAAR